MPKPNVGAQVGRDGAGRIVLDITSLESPAASLRLTLDDPEAALRIADQLAEHANDDDANRRAYPDCFYPSEAEQAVLNPRQYVEAFRDVVPLTPSEEQAVGAFFARTMTGGAR